jgi:hypothetical protein
MTSKEGGASDRKMKIDVFFLKSPRVVYGFLHGIDSLDKR